jgi:hypothetical protein
LIAGRFAASAARRRDLGRGAGTWLAQQANRAIVTRRCAMSDSNPRNEPADSADDAQRALQAVQFALDRRDNGGAGTPRD